ncbi:MAG: hypothetical protein LBU65_03795 [Planctomycetaceae bacterium]|jgi:predicted nucleic acid-binding protein|nr:hypothetical protein [Planctomycetaceae bacterium]
MNIPLIYLDNCCFNRPFDNHTDDVIRLESDAVLTIIEHCRSRRWNLCGSAVLDDEMENNQDIVKRVKILYLYQTVSVHIALNKYIVARAEKFQQEGISVYDALHWASAEYAEAAVLLTTDKKFILRAKKVSRTVPVVNPVLWLMENFYEQ